MIITLKRPGTCADCGAELPAGTRAKWYRSGKVYGLGCHNAPGTVRRSSERRMTQKELLSSLRHISYRRDCIAFTHAHSSDPQKQREYDEAMKRLDGESDQLWDRYYRTNPGKVDSRKRYDTGRDEGLASMTDVDAQYEERCAEITGH